MKSTAGKRGKAKAYDSKPVVVHIKPAGYKAATVCLKCISLSAESDFLRFQCCLSSQRACAAPEALEIS